MVCERHGRAATVEAAGVAEDDAPRSLHAGAKDIAEWKPGQDAGLANSLVTPLSPSSNAKPMPGTRGSGWKCGWNMVARVSGLSTEPCLLAARSQKGGDVASDVGRRGVHPAPAGGRDLAVGDRLEAAGAQHISGCQVRAGPVPIG